MPSGNRVAYRYRYRADSKKSSTSIDVIPFRRLKPNRARIYISITCTSRLMAEATISLVRKSPCSPKISVRALPKAMKSSAVAILITICRPILSNGLMARLKHLDGASHFCTISCPRAFDISPHKILAWRRAVCSINPM